MCRHRCHSEVLTYDHQIGRLWLLVASQAQDRVIVDRCAYLPSNAGGTIWGAGKVFGGHPLSPWTGFAVLCGYAVVLTGLAAWRLRRRDA